MKLNHTIHLPVVALILILNYIGLPNFVAYGTNWASSLSISNHVQRFLGTYVYLNYGSMSGIHNALNSNISEGILHNALDFNKQLSEK